ncbi:MAG: DVUA0089 family protein [Gammaproteobacteria bacterium]
MNPRKLTLPLIAAALLGALSSGAFAATENLALDNGTLATAQNVDPFGLDGTINVFGFRGSVLDGAIVDNDAADFYSFTVAANTRITLAVTTPGGPLFEDDPVVALFDASGLELSVDDDGGAGYDSLLSYNVLLGGTYFAAVSGFADFDFVGGGSTDFLYQLQISAAPVPLPAPLVLLGSALAVFAVRRRPA